MTTVDLPALLGDADRYVADELKAKPDVTDVGHDLDLTKLPITARRWSRLDDMVAVVADLKQSTQLSVGKHAASTASIYEAAIRPAADLLNAFAADDMDIQGDGIVGMFWGEGRTERAVCAAITLKTFSAEHLQKRLDAKWPKAPATGFKVGVASGSVLVKRLGLPRTAHQEEVWAGKPINYAAKASQSTDRGGLVVTSTIWNRIENNDYLAYTCDCACPSPLLWQDVTVDPIPTDDPDHSGKTLLSQWCAVCGAAYCQAILDGKRRRDSVQQQRAQAALDAKARSDRHRRTQLRSLR